MSPGKCLENFLPYKCQKSGDSGAAQKRVKLLKHFPMWIFLQSISQCLKYNPNLLYVNLLWSEIFYNGRRFIKNQDSEQRIWNGDVA